MKLKARLAKDSICRMIYDGQHRELDTVAKVQQHLGRQGAQASVKGKEASHLLRQRGTLPAERNLAHIRMLDLTYKPKKVNDRSNDPKEVSMSQEVHNRLTESYISLLHDKEHNKDKDSRTNLDNLKQDTAAQFTREQRVPHQAQSECMMSSFKPGPVKGRSLMPSAK